MSRRRRRGAPNSPLAAADDATTGPAVSARFLRGLYLGALVGAAIAGSAIWERLRQRGQPTDPLIDRENRPG